MKLEKLDQACADGRITVEDADTVRDFAAFLTEPSCRCLICLTDDQTDADWRTHKRLGRVFLCRECKPTGVNAAS